MGSIRFQVGQTDHSSRWVHVHPGSVGKPRAWAKGQRHSRPIEDTYGGVRPYGGCDPGTWTSEQIDSAHYVGKPDTAMSCPSGLEEAGRKRTSVMRLRAALPSYTRFATGKATRFYKRTHSS